MKNDNRSIFIDGFIESNPKLNLKMMIQKLRYITMVYLFVTFLTFIHTYVFMQYGKKFEINYFFNVTQTI